MITRRPRTAGQVATGLGALSIVTAVSLAGTVAPAQAAEGHPDDHRPPTTGAIPRLPAAENDGTHTVSAGETVSEIAARYDTTTAAVVAANGLGPRALIRIGQVLVLPGAGTVAASPSSTTSYTVVAGDTLSQIAVDHGTTVAALTSLNSLTSTVIYPGQQLRLSGAAAPASTTPAPTPSGNYTVRSGDTVSGIAARFDTTISAIVAANNLSTNALIRIGQVLQIPGASATPAPATTSRPATSQSPSASYTVVAGDTLSGIASRTNTTVSALSAANGLTGSVIYPGQTLALPGGAAPTNLVPSTFGPYTYSDDVVAAANANKWTLLQADLPTASQMQQIIRDTAIDMGVDPALALAVAYQESGFDPTAVSPANAVGAMQVIPSSGEWASDLVGRDLNLLDPYDNAVAGVAILRWLVANAADLPTAIAGYYQGLGSVRSNGMFADTRRYVANIQTLMTRYA